MARIGITKKRKRTVMERLRGERRWQAACDRREQLRDEGMSADAAWEMMEQEFPAQASESPDGQPDEVG